MEETEFFAVSCVVCEGLDYINNSILCRDCNEVTSFIEAKQHGY